MRYYHPFPEAIPLSEAGSSRVTHPSATKNQKQALNSPFDLHVLSVPPAFVLSQDQTLYKVCIYSRSLFSRTCLYRSKASQTFARNYLFVRTFFSLVWLSQRFNLDFSKSNFKGLFACSTLFNFQDTFFFAAFMWFAFSLWATTHSLYHIFLSLSSKQSVNFFLNSRSSFSFFSSFLSRSLPTALLLYHAFHFMSRGFWQISVLYALFCCFLLFCVAFA